MTVRTRGSAALDKAQRRLASLKSIDESLDFGHDLNVAAYSKLIDEIRAELEDYNTQLSEVAEKRKGVTQKERVLSAMSSRMLTGVASRYGKTSVEYIMAGGADGSRPRSRSSAEASNDAE
jgi:hypothetical protein